MGDGWGVWLGFRELSTHAMDVLDARRDWVSGNWRLCSVEEVDVLVEDKLYVLYV